MRKDAQLISLVGLILIFGVLNAAAQQNPGTGAAWGENPDGQFGNGTNTPSATPVPAVTNLSGLIAVSGGGLHSLWLKGDGTVWAAGSNGAGQLGGVGPYPGCTGPGSVTAIQVPGLSGVVAISAGFGHSMALKNDGTVWVWGSDVELIG